MIAKKKWTMNADGRIRFNT